MKMDLNNVGDYKLISIREFIDTYHKGLTPPSINYAILSDKVDFVQPSRERLIVLTEKTLRYQPNDSKKRKALLEL